MAFLEVIVFGIIAGLFGRTWWHVLTFPLVLGGPVLSLFNVFTAWRWGVFHNRESKIAQDREMEQAEAERIAITGEAPEPRPARWLRNPTVLVLFAWGWVWYGVGVFVIAVATRTIKALFT